MAQKASKTLAASNSGASEVSFPAIGYNGAEFSEEEVRHPQAFGRAYHPSNTDAGQFVRDLDVRGFQYAAGANLNPKGIKAEDYDYLVGLYGYGDSSIYAHVLIRNRKTGKLWFSNYDNVINYDQWLSLAVELINGWGFSPGDEQ